MKILEVLTKERITGNIGERLAEKYLKKSGYKILKRNYVAENSEIDLIVKSKDTVVFVEVKSRNVGTTDTYLSRPAEAVNPKKQQGIIKAASYFLSCNYEYRGYRVRFDVVEVYQSGRKSEKINHLINTFDRDTAYGRSYK